MLRWPVHAMIRVIMAGMPAAALTFRQGKFDQLVLISANFN